MASGLSGGGSRRRKAARTQAMEDAGARRGTGSKHGGLKASPAVSAVKTARRAVKAALAGKCERAEVLIESAFSAKQKMPAGLAKGKTHKFVSRFAKKVKRVCE